MRSLILLLTLPLLSLCPEQITTTIGIKGPFDNFTTDELGNVYTLKGDVLELYDARGKRLMRNSTKTFGRVSAIDAFYSLKPVIFSAEQRQLAMLDNTLSVQGSVIDLPRNGFPWVSQVCASVQNAFWFFDERALALTRVDAQLKPLASTGRLDQLLGHAPQPTQLTEHASLLYMVDPGHGVHVFDLFGTWMRTLPITTAARVQVRNDRVFHVEDGTLMMYDPITFASAIVPGVPPGARDIRFEGKRTYHLTAEGVSIIE